MIEKIEKKFKEIISDVDFCSIRIVSEKSEQIYVRQDVLQPIKREEDLGAMITVIDKNGMGYAGTTDLSSFGLKTAFAKAKEWAKISSGKNVVDYSKIEFNPPKGEYKSPVVKSWNSISTNEKIDLLSNECEKLNTDSRVVDWMSFIMNREMEVHYITANGGSVYQNFNFIIPHMSVTVNEGSETIQRSTGARGGRQAGLEVLDKINFHNQAPVLTSEALQLLTAPNCPNEKMDLLLDPDQMILQIHESIGHPLEIDRILGDERNYAGTSFVTQEMFGSYQYGSELLNITFNPTVQGELASYSYDDDGQPAGKKFIIEKGILKKGLGSITSQKRSELDGVANSRAQNWNRQPIDRIANLNLEPGDSNFDDMVSSVEKGIFMKTNCSWSIDDSRNKFQFGCELGQLIENGKLTKIVKKPNYRGISATFWRNLKMTGNEDTNEILGTPNCGKGEPNQVIWVGHASPVCLFSNVDVFGGE